jgi:glycerol uptake facilitator-like aquaporin
MGPTTQSPLAWRKALAECAGTFAVTFTAMAVDIAYFNGSDIGNPSRWLARGFIATVVIYTFSDLSGAHCNPVVTLAFWLRRAIGLRLGCVYVAAQFAGAALATGLGWFIFNGRIGFGASHPGPGVPALTAACTEAALTAIMLVTVLITANEAAIGKDIAIAVGFSIAACGFAAGSISGASMNPARSIVPQLLSGQAGLSWIYLAGPLAGTVLAVVLTAVLLGSRREAKAAEGDD